ELKIDEIVDWLWEELKLPELKPRRAAALDEPDYVREGWDKRGARARLDRRRTVKEAVKRRAVQDDPVAFTNDDLRFRQLVKRAMTRGGTTSTSSTPPTARTPPRTGRAPPRSSPISPGRPITRAMSRPAAAPPTGRARRSSPRSSAR